MIACVALVALLLATTCAAAASRAPLREIGDGSTATVCGNVVVHANAAISAANRGDSAIGHAVVRLRSIDFEEAVEARRNGVHELARWVSDADENAARGAAEVKRLSEIAERSQGPQRAELRAFTAPLGTAFELQRKTVNDLATFLDTVETYAIRPGPRDANVTAANRQPPVPSGRAFVRTIASGVLAEPSSLSVEPRTTLEAAARTTASDVENRANAVAAQETRAAEHAEAAVRGCS